MTRAITFALVVATTVYGLLRALGTPDGWAHALAPAAAFTAGSIALVTALILAALRELFT